MVSVLVNAPAEKVTTASLSCSVSFADTVTKTDTAASDAFPVEGEMAVTQSASAVADQSTFDVTSTITSPPAAGSAYVEFWFRSFFLTTNDSCQCKHAENEGFKFHCH